MHTLRLEDNMSTTDGINSLSKGEIDRLLNGLAPFGNTAVIEELANNRAALQEVYAFAVKTLALDNYNTRSVAVSSSGAYRPAFGNTMVGLYSITRSRAAKLSIMHTGKMPKTIVVGSDGWTPIDGIVEARLVELTGWTDAVVKFRYPKAAEQVA